MVVSARVKPHSILMTMENLLIDYLDRNKTNEGCIKIIASSLTWLVYFKYGKIVYATNSLQPFERIDRHLKRLSHQVPSLTNNFRSALSQRFENREEETSSDLQAIYWLTKEGHLDESLASRLVIRICEEVLATQLLVLAVTDCRIEVDFLRMLPKICSFDPVLLMQGLNKRLAAWQSLGPVITSPYQRPCLGFNNKIESSIKLTNILRGFNFRQLSAIHNEDEIVIARRLYPLIEKGSVILRPPQSPFDLLPNTYQFNELSPPAILGFPAPPAITDIGKSALTTRIWKVICVDDSEAMLMEIQRLLVDQNLEVFTINDPMKAMMKINSIRPDLILMDIGMPHLDGYQLCSLLRKSTTLKSIPIVMVTGNKSIIDRARAKMVGATDYLTKPFSQEELHNVVFRYLN